MTIVDAMRDRALFGPWFSGESWSAWLVFLSALFGLALDDAGLELFTRCTGRTMAPTLPAREGWVIVGRRGGKSRVAALLAVYIAAFRDHKKHLAPGESATVMVLSPDRKQSRVVFKYVLALLHGVPMLEQMIVNETRESVELTSGAVIEIHTASYRSTRGYSCAAVIVEECAFLQTDEGGANPDAEIINALRPSLATFPGSLLLAISSPYARRGALWDAYRRHFAKDGDPVFVWQASTHTMDPVVDEQVIATAYEEDEAAAAAEYGAQFRRDLEDYVSKEALEAVTMPGRTELLPSQEHRHFAFVDPSGGSQDSMTLAIAHRGANGVGILDLVIEKKPPFDPRATVAEFVATVKRYAVGRVTGDRYAGEWVRAPFREYGISYELADRSKSDLYRDTLPLINSRRVELLDHRKMLAQFASLERRTTRAGKDSIDHAPAAHDDIANSVAGVLVAVTRPMSTRVTQQLTWG